MISNMTCAELLSATELHPYLLCRLWTGKLMGINSKIAKIAIKNGKMKDLKADTEFTSYIPVSFIEYISFKHPFL